MTVAEQFQPASDLPRNALCVAIEAGAPIPAPGAIIMADSPVTDLAYRVTIKSIVRVEWVYDSHFHMQIIGIRVWVRGEKEVVSR